MLFLAGRPLGLAPSDQLTARLCQNAPSSQLGDILSSLSREDIISAIKLAKRHDIAHLVCSELLSGSALKGDEALERAMNKELILAHLRCENLCHELERVCACLSDAQIPHIPLKGSVLRSLYPEPWMRSSCDIDVLVPEELLVKAQDALISVLEYEKGERGGHDVAFTSKSGVHVELHFGTVEEGRASDARSLLMHIWDHATPVEQGGYTHRLSDAMFYFYHIAHMAKHFENGGSGVRPLIDMVILESSPEADRGKREELLALGGLEAFERECMLLAKRWFGSEEAPPSPDTAFTEGLGQFILHGGAFGTVENMVTINQSKSGSRAGYVLSRLFMPYSRLKLIYPVLERHKWLFPFYQVVRWIKVITDKRVGRSVEEMKRSGSVSQRESENAKMMLERLGL